MKSETEIQRHLERHKEKLDRVDGRDLSHTIGYRNALRWVLDGDD